MRLIVRHMLFSVMLNIALISFK